MTEHETSPSTPTRKEVEQALAGIDFPLQKEALVRCARDANAGDAVIRQLEALPLATYESADEVLRSVQLADQPGS